MRRRQIRRRQNPRAPAIPKYDGSLQAEARLTPTGCVMRKLLRPDCNWIAAAALSLSLLLGCSSGSGHSMGGWSTVRATFSKDAVAKEAVSNDTASNHASISSGPQTRTSQQVFVVKIGRAHV